MRCILSSCNDVSGGESISKTSKNVCPDPTYWIQWSVYLEEHWLMHINNIIHPIEFNNNTRYIIDNKGVKQLESSIYNDIMNNNNNSNMKAKLKIEHWSELKLHSFIHHCIRGFLRYDIYNAVTELLKRAEGSFGLVIHCTLEPGTIAVFYHNQPHRTLSFIIINHIE